MITIDRYKTRRIQYRYKQGLQQKNIRQEEYNRQMQGLQQTNIR